MASEKHSSLKLYSLVPSSPSALPVFLLIWVSLRNARLTPSIPAGRRVLCSSESAPVRGRLVQLFVHHPCEKADKNACLYQTFPQVATESLRKVIKKGTITWKNTVTCEQMEETHKGEISACCYLMISNKLVRDGLLSALGNLHWYTGSCLRCRTKAAIFQMISLQLGKELEK